MHINVINFVLVIVIASIQAIYRDMDFCPYRPALVSRCIRFVPWRQRNAIPAFLISLERNGLDNTN